MFGASRTREIRLGAVQALFGVLLRDEARRVLRDGMWDLPCGVWRRAAMGSSGRLFLPRRRTIMRLQNFVRGCARMAPPQGNGLCGFFERSMYANSACER